MKRVIYRVLPGPDGGWTLAGKGRVIPGGVTVQRYRRKVDAVASGKRRCRQTWTLGVLAQLVIYGRNGRIQSERTFGKDPRKYQG
jgi:hypothetical protein